MAKGNLRRKDFISSYSLKSTVQQNQSRKFRYHAQGKNTSRAHGGVLLTGLLRLLACSLWLDLLALHTHIIQEQLPRGGTTSRGLGTLTSIMNQENTILGCPKANPIRLIFSTEILSPPMISILGQVDKTPVSRVAHTQTW